MKAPIAQHFLILFATPPSDLGARVRRSRDGYHAANSIGRLRVTEMRIEADGETLYTGPPVSVPAAGDVVRLHDTERRVEARTWELSDTAISVTLLLAPVSYTA